MNEIFQVMITIRLFGLPIFCTLQSNARLVIALKRLILKCNENNKFLVEDIVIDKNESIEILEHNVTLSVFSAVFNLTKRTQLQLVILLAYF